MSTPPPTEHSPVRRAAPWSLVAAVFAVVAAAQIVAIDRCALPVYGEQGAEYLEHSFREQTTRLLAERSLTQRLWHLPGDLAGQDETYPALLHLLAAAWASFFGDGVAAAVHMNLPLLLVLAVAVGLTTRRLPVVLGYAPASSTAAALAATATLLTPAMFATARRYYYDLPSTAAAAVALLALLYLPRSTPLALLAGAATAAALLTKWTAGFYLAGPWLLAATLAGLQVRRRRNAWPLLRLAGAALLVALLCSPVLRNSAAVHGAVSPVAGMVGLDWQLEPTRGSSLDTALGLGGGTRSLSLTDRGDLAHLVDKVVFYGRGLVASAIGPCLSAVMATCVALGAARRWRVPALAAALDVPVALVLLFKVDVLDERFLLGMLPAVMVATFSALDASPLPHSRAAAVTTVLAAGLLQLAAIDGHLAQGSVLAPRSPAEHRGWNLAREVPCSPLEDYEALVRRACGVQRDGGVVLAASEVAEHAALVWMLERHCDDAGVVVMPAAELAALPPPLASPMAAHGAAITADPLAPPWPGIELAVPSPALGVPSVHLIRW